MKSFLRTVLASCLGYFLAAFVILGALFFIGMVAGLSGGGGDDIKTNSVLKVGLPSFIPEQTNNTPVDWYEFEQDDIWGIHDYAYAIEKAADDDKIKALVIQTSAAAGGFVKGDVLRRAIQNFKASGKPVYAYGDYYTQGEYYLASCADQIFVNPLGQISLEGFALKQAYMKEALKNIGVEMEIYYAGNFKSATEPFRRNDMSPENRLQLREFLDEIYQNFLDTLSSSRNISQSHLREIADGFLSRNANDAVELKLADHVGYDSDMYKELKKELGMEEDDKLYVIGLNKYRSIHPRKKKYSSKNKVALVFAEGELREGDSEGIISSKKYLKILRKIKKKDDIKAVVLRVNSPGGSALTSDKILEEIRLLKEKGKKVVVSMGDMAASGGYYISVEADKIFAEKSTLTGSIGVFSMFPNFSELANQKLNVYMDSVRTSKFAGAFDQMMVRTPEEKAILQEMTDEFYETFLGIVATGRNMTRDQVHEVAQGRIWTGTKAKELGLVDELGDLDEAIAYAVELAEVEEDYRLVRYPELKKPLEQMMDNILNRSSGDRMKKELYKQVPVLEAFEQLLEEPEPKVLMPFSIDME